MARDTLTLQVMGAEGAQEKEDLAYTAVVAANDIEFANDGNVLILIKNGGAGAQDAEFISVADEHGRTGNLTVSTTNAKESIAGPFPPVRWNQSDGKVHIDFTTEDSLSVAAIKLGMKVP